ncbi:hypothetical protein [Flavobacterium sp. N1736]|uniref:hypothetical protein n=1 Tax=Flavobacterium sp. N1736 TaxID=2986823 RepID=UPI002223EFFF|nr:hypothetical protein [Flavobacterium sp. N1736]
MMRKYASLLLFALLLNGCDDGDITVDNIDFKDGTATNCTDENLLVYKLKNQESLLLQVAENTFENVPTPDNDPDTFNIDNTNYRLVYRGYDGTITGTYICSLIPPVSPKVIDEWFAKSGVIEIETRAVATPNTTDNSTRITSYNHNIIFRNVTYSVSGVDVTVPEINFGDFATKIASEDQLNLNFTNPAGQCNGLTGQVYNYNAGATITIDNIDPSLIVNSVTPLNAPRTGLVGTTTNKLSYRVYTGGVITSSFFCNTTTPTTPALKETWTGVNGVANESGIIEVTTTTLTATTFKHTIVLKKVTLEKGVNNNFKLGDSFILGELITQQP